MSFSHTDSHRRAYWNCICTCGAEKAVRGDGLSSGNSQSCGCLHREMMAERQTKHGRAGRGTSDYLYHVWENMKARCRRLSHPEYIRYGARGINYCSQWELFADFKDAVLREIGEKPSPELSFDRVDNNGNYEPGNIRWATKLKQAENRRNFTPLLAFAGEARTLAQWARHLGVKRQTLSKRIRCWGMERALSHGP